MEVGLPTHFTVHTKGAGKAKLDVQFSGPTKGPATRDVEIIDNHDYSYTVKYTALQQVGAPAPRDLLAPPTSPQGEGTQASGLYTIILEPP